MTKFIKIKLTPRKIFFIFFIFLFLPALVKAGLFNDPCSLDYCFSVSVSVNGQVANSVSGTPADGQTVNINSCQYSVLSLQQECQNNTLSGGSFYNPSIMESSSFTPVAGSLSNFAVSGSSDPNYRANSVSVFCPGSMGQTVSVDAGGNANLSSVMLNVPSLDNHSCSLVIDYLRIGDLPTNPALTGCSGSVNYNTCNMGVCTTNTLDYANYFSDPSNPPFNPNDPATCPKPLSLCASNNDCQTNLDVSITPLDQQMIIGQEPYKIYSISAQKVSGPPAHWGLEIQCPFNTECQVYNVSSQQLVNFQNCQFDDPDGDNVYGLTCFNNSMAFGSWKVGYFNFEDNSNVNKNVLLYIRSSTLGNYTINARAYVVNHPQAVCAGDCNVSTTASFRVVNPACRDYIVGGPSRITCEMETINSYRIRWTPGTWNGMAGQGIPTQTRIRVATTTPNGANIINSGCGSGPCTFFRNSDPFDEYFIDVTGLKPGTQYSNRVVQMCTDSSGGNSMYKDDPDQVIGWGGDPSDWTCSTRACNPVTYNSSRSGVSTSASGPALANISVSPNANYYAFCDYGVVSASIPPPSGCNWDTWVNGTTARYLCTAPSSPQTVNVTCRMNNDNGAYNEYYCANTNSNIATVTVAGACTPGDTRTVGSAPCTGIETCDASGNWPGSGYNYSGSNNASCNDSVACNGPDVCSSGVCSGGAVITGNVTLTPSTINSGDTSTASVSGGWTNVNYSSSNTAVATVSGSTVTGVGGGSSSISGTGTVPGGYDNNCSINPATINVNPPACPSSGNTVTLSSNTTSINNSVTASAPAGWSGGSFSSNDTSKATVSVNTVTGQGVGSANISGSGWTASNGAVNCGLNPATVSVSDFTLTIAEPDRTIYQGDTASYTVQFASVNSFAGTINLSCSGNPVNSTCAFVGGNTVVLTAGGTATKTLEVDTDPSVAQGSYVISATGVFGSLNRSDTSGLLIDIVPSPTDPTNVVATNICPGNNIQLTWTNSTGGLGVITYTIYRDTDNNIAGATTLTTSGTSPYTDTTAVGGQSYYYWVRAVAGGQSNAAISNQITSGNCPPPPPTGGGGPGGGAGGLCGQIDLTWTDVTGETGYYVYRNTTGSGPAVPGDRVATKAANVVTHTDSVAQGTYYYWISSYNGIGESSRVAITPASVGSTSCNGSLRGDKDITTVNGSSPTGYNPGNGNGNQTPGGVTYQIGDKVGFAINIEHNGAVGTEDAESIIITDRLINLIEPATGWNVKRGASNMSFFPGTGPCNNTSILNEDQYAVCGSEPNQTILMKIPDMSEGDVSTITFSGEVSCTNCSSQISSRFQNTAGISYTENSLGDTDQISASTPLLLFNISNVPAKTEVAP